MTGDICFKSLNYIMKKGFEGLGFYGLGFKVLWFRVVRFRVLRC